MNERETNRRNIINKRIIHLHETGMRPSRIAKEAKSSYAHVANVIRRSEEVTV